MATMRPSKLAALIALLVAVSSSGVVLADTSAPLPKGYTSDQLPQLPQSQQPQTPAQPVNDTTSPAAAGTDEYADTDPSALTDFREPLAPYGAWVQDPTYGTVWVPSATVVGSDFAPYQTAGHWETTVDGDWLWVSDYEWGYVPFHYGRWVWISGTGWAWIPGRVYAPAWVVWRTGDGGYIGWAPMPPAYYWYGGVAVTLWVVPPAAYVFCPTAYVFHTHVHHYVVHDHAKVTQIARTTRPYKPASPTAHKPASPSGSPAGSGGSRSASSGAPMGKYRGPASPSLDEARIPPQERPKTRASHDVRATSFARRSTTPRSMASRGPGSFQATPGSAPAAPGRGPAPAAGPSRAPAARSTAAPSTAPAPDARSSAPSRGTPPSAAPAPRAPSAFGRGAPAARPAPRSGPPSRPMGSPRRR